MNLKIKLNLITIFSFIFMYCFVGNVLAKQPKGFGSVLDNNNGSQGQILVNTGKDNGNSDIGT